MKVNISYSVDLEEVLPSAFSLYEKELKKLKKATELASKSLEKPFDDESLIQTLGSIKEYREASHKFDEKLVEISNILVGYAQIRYKQDAVSDQTQEQQKEEEND